MTERVFVEVGATGFGVTQPTYATVPNANFYYGIGDGDKPGVYSIDCGVPKCQRDNGLPIGGINAP